MTAPATQKRIIFVGSYLDLFNALQAAREQQDNDVIAAINEQQADDREPVDEAPFCDAWCLEGYDYIAYIPILERRRDEILAIFKEEPLTKEQADALIEELAEIQTRLD